MTVTILVPLIFKNEHKKPNFTTKQNLPPYEPDRFVPFSKELKASGMVNFKQRMEAPGISEKAAEPIKNIRCKNASTKGCYKSAWNK